MPRVRDAAIGVFAISGGVSISLYEQRWGRVIRGSSAEKMAMLRAFANNERDPSVRNPDYLAGDFAGSSRTYRLGLALARVTPVRASARLLADLVAEGGYWTEAARVKHYDEILLDEVSNGVPQVLVLGAGLDSRAYRFAERLKGVRVFEVDQPAMTSYKRGRVEATFGSTPAHVAYVAHDLTTRSLEEALVDSGFDVSAPVLVLWIGVTMYLPSSVVDEVLAWVGGLPEGSSLGFDYMEQGFFEDEKRFSLEGKTRLFFALGGEHFVGGFEDSSVSSLLERKGLRVESHLNPRQAEDKYLRRRNGRKAGPIFPHWRFVHARVAEARGPASV